MNIFGRLLTDDAVEDAVVATLKKWIDTELRLVEEERDLPARTYERPRGWGIHSDMDKFPEEQLPAIIVVTLEVNNSGKSGRKIRATWSMSVTSITSSTDMEATRKKTLRLGTAVRGALVHRQSLDGALPTEEMPSGTVRGVRWDSSSNRELPLDADRTIWGIRQVFDIEVDDVMTQSAGPAEPDAPPPPVDEPLPSWGKIPDREHIITTVQKEPIT